MATSNNSRDVKMTLSVETLGSEDIQKLQNDVARLAKEGGDAAPEFQALADEIARLGEQASALRSFEALSEQTSELAARQTQAAASTAELKLKLEGLQDATAQTKANQSGVAAALAQVAAASRDTRTEIELLALNTSKAGKADQAYKAEKDGLAAKLIFQKVQVEQLSAELRKADSAVKQAAAAEAKLADAYGRSAKEAKAAADATAASQDELARAVASATALGVATDNVAVSQAKLVQSLNQAGSAAKQTSDKLTEAARGAREFEAAVQLAAVEARKVADASEQAAAKIKNAFQTVGVRSAQDLQSEIAQVRAAMETVRGSASGTGAALVGAFSAGEARIKALEQDIRRVSGTLTTADKAANLFKNSMGQVTAGNIIADGVGYMVNKVKELGVAFFSVNIEAQRMTRALGLIYKDTAVAAEQFEFLRKTASTAGVGVSDISSAFVRFSAATKASGIPLEETNRLFVQITRAAGQLGLSGEQVGGTLEALGQIASKGTVSMEELRQQLGDRLPGALSIAAKGLDVTEENLIKLVETGNLTAKQFFPAFEKGLRDTFGDGTARVEGFLQAWNRLRNAITQAAQQASETTLFKRLGDTLDFVAENFNTVVAASGALVKTLLALKAVEIVGSFLGIGRAAKTSAAAIAAKTVVVVADTAATAVNTAATDVNTASKGRNAAAFAELGAALAGTGAKSTQANAALSNVAGALEKSGTAAQTASAAKGLLAGSLGLLGSAARSATALIGGLPGVLLLVAVNARDLGTVIGESAAKLFGWGKVMTDAETALAKLAEQEKKAAEEKRNLAFAQDQLNLKISQAASLASAAADVNVQTSEKILKAKQAEAVASEALAKLAGVESVSLLAAADSSAKLQVATGAVAASKLQLVEKIQLEILAVEKTVSAGGKLTQSQTEQIQKLQELLVQRKTEADQSIEQARLSSIEAAERRIASETYKDNSERVDELRTAYENANTKLEVLNLSGTATGVQLNQAMVDAATGARIYRDALDDSAKALDRQSRARDANLSLEQAKLSVQQASIRNEIEYARSIGDTARVLDLQVSAKQLEIKAITIGLSVKKLDLDADLAKIEVDRQKLTSTGTLRVAEEAELAIKIKVIEAKRIDLGLGLEQIKALENEVTALRNSNGERGAGTAGVQRDTQLRDQNTTSINRQTDALVKQDATKAQYTNPKGGSVTGSSREERLAGQAATDGTGASALEEKRRNGTLSADDLGTARAAKSAADFNRRQFEENGKSFSLEGGRSINEESNRANTILAQVEALAAQARGITTSAPPATAPAAQADATGVRNRTVTINMGGRSTAIGVSSQQDSDALVGMLRGLESGRETAQ